MTRRSGWWTGILVATCAACHGPSLAVEAHPAGARLLVDGRRTETPSTLPFRYYGTVELRALPAPRDPGEAQPFLAATAREEVAPPAPKWLFPLDFVVELVRRPFLGIPTRQASVRLREDPDPVTPGFHPPHLSDLRRRARSARAAR